MTEFRGTPGPWSINRHGAIVGGAFHQYSNGSAQSQVAMATGTREVNEGEMRANAMLIAAAPEMLDLLNDISNWLVCAPIASAEDMAQSYGAFQQEIDRLLDKALGK